MIHRPFSEEVQNKMREVALNVILPNWVERTGGPNSDAAAAGGQPYATTIPTIKLLPSWDLWPAQLGRAYRWTQQRCGAAVQR